MGRKNVFEKRILEALKDGKPRTLDEIREIVGAPYRSTLNYNLYIKEDSLVDRGCVAVVEEYPEAKEFTGNIARKYVITEKGRSECLEE